LKKILLKLRNSFRTAHVEFEETILKSFDLLNYTNLYLNGLSTFLPVYDIQENFNRLLGYIIFFLGSVIIIFDYSYNFCFHILLSNRYLNVYKI